ncbi:hypothetical protein KP509_21G055900 [Ceratopteris richardii]|uniref:Uncharacterized protein n=1 Tax=Ceratopteris richardii TaxID=49495 RepID=A0A8T2SD37_CERRI|nr:hypothetical protein KP509_21G055900 [Ceratopteris richardii]
MSSLSPMLLLYINTIFFIGASVVYRGSMAQVLCNLDQIEVTQTLVLNTSISTSSYVYGEREYSWRRGDDRKDVDFSNLNGGIQQGDSIFHVKVANNCPCSAAAAIMFFCDGFIPGLVSKEILSVEGAECLLIGGEALLQLQPVRFDYASPRQLPLFLVSADFTC